MKIKKKLNKLKSFLIIIFRIENNQDIDKDINQNDNQEINQENRKDLLQSTPICPQLGINYPFPPHLEYRYPVIDQNIASNIINSIFKIIFNSINSCT